jgi:CBS-domain-containing membrane protein
MLKIADIMTPEVFTLPASCRADQAAWELRVRGFSGAPVRDDLGRLVGVLSRTDLADPERVDGALESKLVQDLMTRAIFMLRQSEPLMQAVKLMVRESIHRVIVVDDSRQMIGIVTSSDVLSALARGEMVEDPYTDDERRAPAAYTVKPA